MRCLLVIAAGAMVASSPKGFVPADAENINSGNTCKKPNLRNPEDCGGTEVGYYYSATEQCCRKFTILCENSPDVFKTLHKCWSKCCSGALRRRARVDIDSG
ncbi:uncharacterized protein LOC142563962 isoform X2 [Dermacentor variabilis]|uniref:uncharacterized protein LOC142563962 isoform X2 n=1 Tax=Dermacentor variabilis TaxID=34621 RepID=UPI003F5B7B15